MMYTDAKEDVELGGEEPFTSDTGALELVRECVFRVTVKGEQPPQLFAQTRYNNCDDS